MGENLTQFCQGQQFGVQGGMAFFDHLEFQVKDLGKSTQFYRSVLGALGVRVLLETEKMTGFGTGKVLGADGIPRVEFLIEQGEALSPTLHLAFSAEERAGVDRFYEAGILSGGRDNGRPGLRENYHGSYYAAFLIDPDGHRIEVVCHRS